MTGRMEDAPWAATGVTHLRGTASAMAPAYFLMLFSHLSASVRVFSAARSPQASRIPPPPPPQPPAQHPASSPGKVSFSASSLPSKAALCPQADAPPDGGFPWGRNRTEKQCLRKQAVYNFPGTRGQAQTAPSLQPPSQKARRLETRQADLRPPTMCTHMRVHTPVTHLGKRHVRPCITQCCAPCRHRDLRVRPRLSTPFQGSLRWSQICFPARPPLIPFRSLGPNTSLLSRGSALCPSPSPAPALGPQSGSVYGQVLPTKPSPVSWALSTRQAFTTLLGGNRDPGWRSP